jgi:8-oxo-dGTP pyrophosphatase MutT (NUDIX family)
MVAGRKLGAAVVILDSTGRVLLVKHTYGKLNWELPGGRSEPNESVEDTARREVREETGLTVVPDRITGIYYDPADDMHHFVFLCHQLDEDAVPHADLIEISETGHWPLDTLPRPISDFTVRRIQDAVKSLSPLLPVVISPRSWLE